MTNTNRKLTTIFFLASLFGLLLAQSGSALVVTIPGTAQWAKSTEVTALGITEFSASSTDSSGNTYAVGYITGTSGYYFGDVQVTVGSAGKNAVIVKYNAAGVAQWAKSTAANAPGASGFSGVSVDSDGYIYAVGYINGDGEYDFGGAAQVNGAGVVDNAVIVKYDSDGLGEWAKSTVTAPDESSFSGVSVDSDGYIYAVGSIVTILDVVDSIPYGFGPGVTATGGYDVEGGSNPVIVKYNVAGVAQWAKSTEDAPAGSSFSGVSVDPDGYIYAGGYIRGIIEFDFGESGHSVPVTGGYDGKNAVIVKYEPTAGDAQWAKSTAADAPGASGFSGVSVDPDGYIYAVGFINGTGEYDFGESGHSVPVTGGYDGASPGEGNNAVIVKYAPTAGDAQWAKSTVVAPSDSSFSGVSVDSSGNIYAVGYITGITEFDFGESGHSVPVTGGYNGGNNAVIVKYNADGLAEWAKSTAAGALGKSRFYGVSVDSSGNIYAVGYIWDDYTYGFGTAQVTGGYNDGYNTVIVKYAGDTYPVPPVPPVPATSSISPASINAGSPGFAMTVTGTGFVSVSVVRFNGTDRVTTFVSETELRADILASDLTTAGTFNIKVFNPAPGGGESNAQTFTVLRPAPLFINLPGVSTPINVDEGQVIIQNPYILKVRPTSYYGIARVEFYIDGVLIGTIVIPDADGVYSCLWDTTSFYHSLVRVVAYDTGGESTEITRNATVIPPVPATSSISPASIYAGSLGFTMTVTGTGFVPVSVVRFNGAGRVTTFVSETELRADILASDLTTAGTFNIKVFNPAPGGGESNAQTFTVLRPAPLEPTQDLPYTGR